MKTWTVQQNGVLNNSIKLRQHAFDAAWISFDNDEEDMCVAAALDNRNYINVSVFTSELILKIVANSHNLLLS